MKYETDFPPTCHRADVSQRTATGFVGFAIVGAALLLCTCRASADCSPAVNLGSVSVRFPSVISVPPNAAIGTVIASVTVPVPGATTGVKYGSCSGSGYIYWQIRDGPVIANRIGTTSVSGIGYTSWLSGGGFGGNLGMDTALSNSSVPGGPTNPTFQSQLSVTVNLVVTGTVGSGPLSLNPGGSNGIAGQVGFMYVGNMAQYPFNAIVPDNSTAIAASSCTVTTSSLAVTLPNVSPGAFQGIGSTAGTQAISIGLNCQASNARVFMTLTDNTTPTNTSSTLSLKAGSTAQGVGLQILNAGGPVKFGPDSPAAGSTNQWFVGTATGGAMSVPLGVRYIQTATPVRPGTVNGIATFTMSYQ